MPAVLVARPALHIGAASLRDGDGLPPPPPGWVDDASGLSRTRAEVVVIDGARPEEHLRRVLEHARATGKPVSIAGARHSMGGQTSFDDGIVVDVAALSALRLDEARGVLKLPPERLRLRAAVTGITQRQLDASAFEDHADLVSSSEVSASPRASRVRSTRPRPSHRSRPSACLPRCSIGCARSSACGS